MDYLTTDTELKAVADAIRAQTGSSEPITYPTGFTAQIASIGTYEDGDTKRY
jgi:hypothetical protein